VQDLPLTVDMEKILVRIPFLGSGVVWILSNLASSIVLARLERIQTSSGALYLLFRVLVSTYSQSVYLRAG